MARDRRSHWCFLRNNSKLKQVIKYKLQQKGLILHDVQKATGVPAYRISAWFNDNRPYPNQYQVLSLCKWLDIEVDIKITLV
jgi:hypothetical protein